MKIECDTNLSSTVSFTLFQLLVSILNRHIMLNRNMHHFIFLCNISHHFKLFYIVSYYFISIHISWLYQLLWTLPRRQFNPSTSSFNARTVSTASTLSLSVRSYVLSKCCTFARSLINWKNVNEVND